ncbi:unnamed protein product [Schistocephalus solidus]|uniref:Uncharacterized protein n=1 Tax=Schistocephalus solidus TaxID=70667 RepID=A0A183T0J8_SCHSO|nr:unnamed protein product [Schistocephalus solidus]
MHPRSRCWQLLYYVLIRRRDRQDVLVTKAIRNTDGWTEHHLGISNMRLRLQPRRRPPSNHLTQKLEDLDAPDDNATVETRWRQLQKVIQSTVLNFSDAHAVNTRTGLTTMTPTSATYSGRRMHYTKPTWTFGLKPSKQPSLDAAACTATAAGDAGRLDDPKAEEIQGYAEGEPATL